ncbi:hypothetical protein SmJEL517_g03168 [Synchytrium microbalum]|uniref:Protein YIP n=1 Tax=Synchytrium microbalum TaxID=1806994 RepID=A0A507C319_9FUNG|nr:uncharacterized protein SmJEL517_g03168 [Synchytrium microbalum]TPX34092.1 hypothetical protein SmJEL517_g03168 [Synchytrium microbalum]
MARKYEALVDVDPTDADDELRFQNFVASDGSTLTGKVTGSPSRAAGSNTPFILPTSGEGGGDGAKRPAAFYSAEFYVQYFNVDSADVLARLLSTINPKSSFMDIITTNPDLYGPFWVSTTVIFSLFVTSCIAGSIQAYSSGTTYTYDFSLLSFATFAVYMYAGLVPLVVWAVGKWWLGIPLKLMEVIDVYGYGLSVWIPVSLLCVFPSDIWRWLLVALALASSALFKVRNLSPVVARAGDIRAKILIPAVLVAHVGFALLFKLGFFKFVTTVAE